MKNIKIGVLVLASAACSGPAGQNGMFTTQSLDNTNAVQQQQQVPNDHLTRLNSGNSISVEDEKESDNSAHEKTLTAQQAPVPYLSINGEKVFLHGFTDQLPGGVLREQQSVAKVVLSASTKEIEASFGFPGVGKDEVFRWELVCSGDKKPVEKLVTTLPTVFSAIHQPQRITLVLMNDVTKEIKFYKNVDIVLKPEDELRPSDDQWKFEQQCKKGVAEVKLTVSKAAIDAAAKGLTPLKADVQALRLLVDTIDKEERERVTVSKTIWLKK